MAYVLADRVKETTTTTGQGAVSLAGAATGFQAFSAVMVNNDTCWYCIAHQSATEWEVGLGTWNTGPVLTRTAGGVLAGSAGAGVLVTFSSGTKDVFITAPASRAFVLDNELTVTLPKVTTVPPTTPATDNLKLYTRSRAGRMLPEFVGPSGLDSSLQPGLFGNSVRMWVTSSGTTASPLWGIGWTVATTQAHPGIANTNFMTQMVRATFTTTTTAGNASGLRSQAACCWRGNAAGQGGFFFFARFGISTYHANMQILCGLASLTTALAGDPSALNDSCGMSKDTGETTWQVYTRDTSSASKTSTGRTTAAGGSAEVFDFTMFCKPNDSKITMRVVDITSSTVLVDNVEKSSNLPTSTVMLVAHCESRNVTGGAGVTCGLFVNRIYIETDT